MGRKKASLRLWAVAFLAGGLAAGGHGPGAAYPHGELLLASPAECAAAAGAAGRHRRLLADGGLVRRPDLRRLSARHGAGGGAGGTGGVETPGSGG